MYKKVDTNLDFVDREKETAKFWKENNIFQKSIDQREGCPTYMKELKDTGLLKLDINGNEIDLAEEDLLIDTAQTEGFETQSDSDLTVVLDKTLTPELIEEGFVRELISKIQTMRKEAGFEVMLNGAPTLGTMDGANVEIVKEVGEENAFIFGLSSDEVIGYEHNGGYDPNRIFNNDGAIRRVLMQLINGTYSQDSDLFRPIYDSLLSNKYGNADRYFILADFWSYADAQNKVEQAYRDQNGWAKKAMMNTACSGKFSSDRTIQEYVDNIWHLDKVTVK